MSTNGEPPVADGGGVVRFGCSECGKRLYVDEAYAVYDLELHRFVYLCGTCASGDARWCGDARERCS